MTYQLSMLHRTLVLAADSWKSGLEMWWMYCATLLAGVAQGCQLEGQTRVHMISHVLDDAGTCER